MKACTNARKDGYRQALDRAEFCETMVHQSIFAISRWAEATAANKNLHDMPLLSTKGDALQSVETVPEHGFETWRLLIARHNAVGEIFALDCRTARMHQSECKELSAMLAAIDCFDLDLNVF